ncbi:MAG TPA: hypothetical protein VF070_29535 [Streptosporangiaceae bacterium]
MYLGLLLVCAAVLWLVDAGRYWAAILIGAPILLYWVVVGIALAVDAWMSGAEKEADRPDWDAPH